ncbi:unknown protein [Microcystis aeruginosa NIES-843]|uniref:Uncharacterized protein n=1 Tax=Microcystis aeruginosa (strain NIES-843 / IAM M-2473) TaxID=449447 RepID=B0JQJ4_MICAN|nr:unknown protein [Microcystis aeruginosa NIES-843]
MLGFCQEELSSAISPENNMIVLIVEAHRVRPKFNLDISPQWDFVKGNYPLQSLQRII